MPAKSSPPEVRIPEPLTKRGWRYAAASWSQARRFSELARDSDQVIQFSGLGCSIHQEAPAATTTTAARRWTPGGAMATRAAPANAMSGRAASP